MFEAFDSKMEHVLSQLEERYTLQEVFNAYLTTYPKDWKQLKIRYSASRRGPKVGKSIPLPKPEVALRKSMSVWLRKHKNFG